MTNNESEKIKFNETKSKLINIRPLFCAFICLIIGIFSTIFYQIDNKVWFYIIETFLLISLIMFICSYFNVKVFKHFINYKMILLIILIFTLLGQVLGTTSFQNLTYRPLEDGKYIIEARIGKVEEKDNSQMLLLENVVINGEQYNFIVQSYISKSLYDEKMIIGNGIIANINLKTLNLFSNGRVNTSVSGSKIFYTGYITSVTECLIGEKTPIENFKESVKDKLYANLEPDIAGLSYAILIGDKYLLNDDIYEIFKNCGLAHTLAISGLHIGMFVLILIFILKKLKIKPKIRLIIMFLILLLYCVICEFAASVLRASIMSIVYLIADCFGKRKDMLSTFSFAGVIVLILFPMQLFSIGFLLSFASVFGIIFLNEPITKLLTKIKIPYKLASAIAITLSTTIATLPIISSVFGYIPVSSLLSNILILPIFTIAYYMLFITTIISFIVTIPFMFTLVNLLFNSIISIGYVFSLAGVIYIKNFGLLASIIYYLAVAIVSLFVNLKFNVKFLSVSTLVIMCLICILLANINHIYLKNEVFSNKNIENCYLYATNSGSFLLGVGNGEDAENEYSQISRMLNYRKVFSLDSIVLIEYDTEYQNVIINLAKNYSINQLIITDKIDEMDLNVLENNIKTPIKLVNFDETYNLDEQIIIDVHMYNDTYFGYRITNEDSQFSVIYKNLTTKRIEYLNSYNNQEILITSEKVEDNKLNDNYIKVTKNFEKSGITADFSINIV